MKKELDCNIVRDLLPSYVDGILSDESKESVDNHLSGCNDCRQVYESMIADIEIDKVPEVDNVKKYLKKTKTMYFLYGLFGLSFIAIAVCLIVNLCVDGGLTWSLISTSAVIFGDAVIYTLLASKKNKLLKTLAVISVGVPVLLSIVQFVLYYLMNQGNLWLFNMGLAIALVWLAVVWLAVSVRYIFKVRIFYCLSIFAFAGIIANYITMMITGDITSANVFSAMIFLRTGLGNLAGGIVFAVLGSIIDLDKIIKKHSNR